MPPLRPSDGYSYDIGSLGPTDWQAERVYVRRSARIALLDADSRVLLLHTGFRRTLPGVDMAWFLPGGGVEDGENIESAAVRELAEETGIEVDPAALIALAYAEGDGTVGDLTGPMRDDIFLCRASTTAISTTGMEDHELRALDRYRWWHVEELASTDEVVFPIGLASTLQEFGTAPNWPHPQRLAW